MSAKKRPDEGLWPVWRSFPDLRADCHFIREQKINLYMIMIIFTDDFDFINFLYQIMVS